MDSEVLTGKQESDMTKIQAHNNLHNEGGEGYNPEAVKDQANAHAKAEARIADLMSRAAEVKAAWNAAVAAHTKNGKVDMRDLPAIEKMAGVTKLEVMTLKSRCAA
jgi:hypothetical protein